MQAKSGIADMATAVMPCDHWNCSSAHSFWSTLSHFASQHLGICLPRSVLPARLKAMRKAASHMSKYITLCVRKAAAG